jgi:hypothetical protein
MSEEISAMHFISFLYKTVAGTDQSVYRLTKNWTNWVRSEQRQGIFPIDYVSRPAPQPTQAPIQMILGALSTVVKSGRS